MNALLYFAQTHMPTSIPPAVYLGTDHAGLALKNAIKDELVRLGRHVHDVGALENDPLDDYPDYIIPVAQAIAASKGKAVGIVFGGSGIGECIAANKVKGVRAALVHDLFTAKKSREHNDANVLCLGSRTATKDIALAKRIVRAWLSTPFTKDARHVRRLKKIATYEA